MSNNRQQSMKIYGKSYYLATLFFPLQVRKDIFLLYAFVRHADDLVDDAGIDSQISRQLLNNFQQEFLD
jgi:phytoene synthase